MADMNDTPGESSDEVRFAQWVHTHGKAVRGFLRGMVRQPDLAEELCQEVFCRAWQARGRYREEGNARAYLLRIADRLACDRSRQNRPVQLDEAGWRANEPASRGVGPSQAVALGEQTQLLAEALEQLSSVQRRVLLLRYYGQFSFAEIAVMLECPLNTTLSHGRRGLEALRKLFEEKSS
jgi:RNA polymerase sigma-70 factor (ECF subfamily)